MKADIKPGGTATRLAQSKGKELVGCHIARYQADNYRAIALASDLSFSQFVEWALSDKAAELAKLAGLVGGSASQMTNAQMESCRRWARARHELLRRHGRG
jgi:hypothetical protein